jgi:hypothetical protein
MESEEWVRGCSGKSEKGWRARWEDCSKTRTTAHGRHRGRECVGVWTCAQVVLTRSKGRGAAAQERTVVVGGIVREVKETRTDRASATHCGEKSLRGTPGLVGVHRALGPCSQRRRPLSLLRDVAAHLLPWVRPHHTHLSPPSLFSPSNTSAESTRGSTPFATTLHAAAVRVHRCRCVGDG